MPLYQNGKFVGASATAAQPKTKTLYDTSGKFQGAPAATDTATATPPTQDGNNLFANSLGKEDPVGHVIAPVLDALTSSEQGFGKDLAATISELIPSVKKSQQAAVDAKNQSLNLFSQLLAKSHQMRAQGKDTTELDKVIADQAKTLGVGNLQDILPEAANKTTGQILGDAGGTLLDTLSAGSYGEAAKGAKTGELLTKGAEAAAPVVAEQATKKTLGQTLKGIAVKTLARAGIGAGTGYAYDVTGNLQKGKTGAAAFTPGAGTAIGGIIPLGIGGLEAGAAITKDTAPRIINSLIKPKAADFSYGKDPGRTVSALGITGNSLNDFSANIGKAKDEIGQKLGAIYSSAENAGNKINGTETVDKIDAAIADAAKGGKNNQGIVTTLQNIKDSLLYGHGVDGEGNIVRTSNEPVDLSSLSPQEAFNLKQEVAARTQFTGRASDDKTVNSVLKSMYGDLKGKLNAAVGGNNPEIKELNQQYADLTSAELATRNRNAIVQRSNMVSMPVKVGGAAAIITALGSGGAAVPAILAGAGAAALDSALASTAVRSRVAAWLGSESPSTIQKVLAQNPGIKTVLYRALPKFASQLGQPGQ